MLLLKNLSRTLWSYIKNNDVLYEKRPLKIVQAKNQNKLPLDIKRYIQFENIRAI